MGVLDRAKHALAAQKALSVTDDVAATAGETTVHTTITAMVDVTTKKVVGEILTQRTRTAATVIERGGRVSVYVTPTVAYFKVSAADLLANGASQPYAAAAGGKWIRSSPADSPVANVDRFTDLCASAQSLCTDPTANHVSTQGDLSTLSAADGTLLSLPASGSDFPVTITVHGTATGTLRYSPGNSADLDRMQPPSPAIDEATLPPRS